MEKGLPMYGNQGARESRKSPGVFWEPLEARLLLNADLTGTSPTSPLEAALAPAAIQVDLTGGEQQTTESDSSLLSYSVATGVSAPESGGSVVPDADVAKMTQFLGSDNYEILDAWVESRRTPAGECCFRMYKVSTGQYLAINEQDGALYDSEGLAALTNAANALLSPLDKISPVLREMADQWGQTQLVTVQLALSPETRQLVAGAFDTEGTEEQAPALEDGGAGAATDEQEIAAQLNQRLAALGIQEVAYRGVIDSFLQRHNVPAEDATGEKIVYRYLYAPAVALNATWEECLAFAADPEVVALHPEVQFAAENERSVAAARTTSAWASGYNGTGAVIAHVESGRMDTTNPYLSATVRPGTYAVANHATACGGIIRSTHSFFQGHATGATLLSAAAATWGQTDIVAATDWAVQQGAMVINCSFGLDSTTSFTWSDIYYDFISANSRVLITKSAGNEGTATGNVTSPGKGFNVLTVGNIHGGTSAAWTDDAMHATSSYVDSVSGGEKPEVAMYGTNIYTTGAGSPWVGNQGFGTSYAAPAVAAFAGLAIDEFPAWSDEPSALKAQIMTSAVVHNIEGASRLSEIDGAGAALGTACNAGGLAVTLTPTSFDSSGYWEWTTDIPLRGGMTNRIVLSYPHLPSSISPATPAPDDYYRSDLDLRLYVGGVQVASSAWGMQQTFEIIDYIPAVDTVGRIKVYKWWWDASVASLRIGIAYGNAANFGTAPNAVNDDAYEENDTFAAARAVAAGYYSQLRLTDQDWFRVSVPAYYTITCSTGFDDDIGDVDLDLYNASQTLVSSSHGVTDLETVSSTNASATAQYFYIKVAGYTDARNVYNMQITLTAPTTPQVSVAVAPASVFEDGTPNLVYTFTRSLVSASTLTVSFTVAGTATYNTDYTQTGAASFSATAGTITIPANQTTAQVTVNPTADTTVEPDETATLTVTTGTGYTVGTPSAATGTIRNDDAVVTLAVSPAAVLEDGAANLVYTFTQSVVTGNARTVNFYVGGTATYNTDYTQTGAATFTATAGTVTIAAGLTTAQVTVNPTADATWEPDETVFLGLTSGTGYTLGTPSTATGTIQNDDPPPVTTTVVVAVAPLSTAEDGTTNLVYTFTRSAVGTGALTVNFSVGGTATYNTDYTQIGATTFTAAAGTVTIPAGQPAAIVAVDPTADTTYESDETVVLTVTTGTGYLVGTPATATGTILNDDPPPVTPLVTVAVSPLSVMEDGLTNLTYTFTRSMVGTSAMLVNFAVGGTATYNTDYTQTGATSFTPTVGTVTIAAGQPTAVVTVDPTADTDVEPNETVVLTVTAGTGYTVGAPAAANGTIQNDDGASVNLALGRPAVASTSYSGMPPANVTDGLLTTRWSSQFSNNEWIYVDLGSSYSIERVVLRWETAYGRGYKIQVSPDAATWSDVYSTTTGDGGVDDFAVVGSGRYVRMLGTQRATMYGYSLWEFEIWGPGGTTNHAPTVSSFSKSGPKDTPLPFAAGDFTAAFWDPDAGDNLEQIKIVSLPSHGSLTLFGTTVTVNQEILTGQIGNLTYTPNAAYTGSDSFLWNGSDGEYYAATAAAVNLSITGGDGTNLALHKPVVASSTYTGLPATSVTDGNLNSRWSSLFSDNQWIYVDLGSVSTFNRVVLRWETAYGRAYKIQVSNDTLTWSDVYTTTTGDGSVDDISLSSPTSARYVRMLGIQRATVYGYSLYEFEVYSQTAAPNLALYKPATASTSYSGLPASNATDGSTASRWSSLFTDNEWIYVDLGATYTIRQVVLRWEAAYGRGYTLQVSGNASTWSDVYSTTTGDGGVDDITLASPVSARYVRLLGTQRATVYGYSLWEFEVYA